MIWVLLGLCITLAWALHRFNEDHKTYRRLFEKERQRYRQTIERLAGARDQEIRLSETRYAALKKWRRRYRSAVKQAKIWSARALELGFSRRDYKDKVRYARQQRRAAKAARQTETPAND